MKKLIPALLISSSLIMGTVLPAAAATKPKVTVPKQETVYKAYKAAYDKTLKEKRYSIEASFPSLDIIFVRKIQYNADLANGLLNVNQQYKKETNGATQMVNQYQNNESYEFDFKTNKYKKLNAWDTEYNGNVNKSHFEIARNILKPYESYLKTAKGDVKTVKGLKEIKVNVPENVATKIYKDIQIGTAYKESNEYYALYQTRTDVDSEWKRRMANQDLMMRDIFEKMLKTYIAKSSLVITVNKAGYIQSVTEKYTISYTNSKSKSTLTNTVLFNAVGDKVNIQPLTADVISQ